MMELQINNQRKEVANRLNKNSIKNLLIKEVSILSKYLLTYSNVISIEWQLNLVSIAKTA